MRNATISNPTLSDAALYDAITLKKTWALSALYDRYATVLYSLALKISGREKTAQKVVEETFVTVWRNSAANNQSIREHLGTWLILLCRTLALGHGREHGQPVAFHAELDRLATWMNYANGTPDAESIAEEGRLLRKFMEQLPKQQKAVFEMAFLKGMKLSEIAASISMGIEEVRLQVHQAMSKIREQLFACHA